MTKLSKEISDQGVVVTCRYQFPIKYDRTIGEGIDAVWLYHSDTVRRQLIKSELR